MVTLDAGEWLMIAGRVGILFFLPGVAAMWLGVRLVRTWRKGQLPKCTLKALVVMWLMVSAGIVIVRGRAEKYRLQKEFDVYLDAVGASESLRVVSTFFDYASEEVIQEERVIAGDEIGRLQAILAGQAYSCERAKEALTQLDRVEVNVDEGGTGTSGFVVYSCDCLSLGKMPGVEEPAFTLFGPENRLLCEIRKAFGFGEHEDDPRIRVPAG